MVGEKPEQKKSFSFLLTLLIIIILDQLTKFLIRSQTIDIAFTINSGSLFGMFKGSALLLVWLSMIVIGVFLYNLEKIQRSNIFVKISSGLIIGGAIGNSIDRILYKGVIDFIDFGWWPSFNIADSALCVGVAFLMFHILREDIKSK